MAFYFRANYSSLMKPCLVLKRPQTCTMNHSHTWSPHYQDTFFTSYPGWWRNWWHNSMQTHKKPSEFSKVWKRKSGRKTERGREVPDRWRVADAADIFSCQIFIFHTNVFFFFPKDMETWPSNRKVRERFSFYNALKLFPYGSRKTGYSFALKKMTHV